jgi:hypothetical protein
VVQRIGAGSADYESTQFCVCCCEIRAVAGRFGVFLSTAASICTVRVQQRDQRILDRQARSHRPSSSRECPMRKTFKFAANPSFAFGAKNQA